MVIEIGMGSVQVGECDVMGHMNVRHYQPVDEVGVQSNGSAWMLTTRTAV